MVAKATTWDDVHRACQEAFDDGWLIDYRKELPKHETRRFRRRKAPADVLGSCSHHSASRNQDPKRTARYHIMPGSHVSEEGCPGLLYTFVISQTVEPGKVLLANDLESITWSQGKSTKGKPEWSGDENRHLVSVLTMGDFNEERRKGKSGEPTQSQLERWDRVQDWLAELFGFGPGAYFGHFDFGKAYCPGKTIRERIAARNKDAPSIASDLAWQQNLLKWNPECLPEYGADGDWGGESRRALIAFERENTHRADGIQDPFTELLLLNKYPL